MEFTVIILMLRTLAKCLTGTDQATLEFLIEQLVNRESQMPNVDTLEREIMQLREERALRPKRYDISVKKELIERYRGSVIRAYQLINPAVSILGAMGICDRATFENAPSWFDLGVCVPQNQMEQVRTVLDSISFREREHISSPYYSIVES